MSVAQFIQYATDALFSVIFLIVVMGAIRQPRRVQLQASFFFGAIFVIILESLLLNHFEQNPPRFVQAISQIALISMSYLLLRLVDSLSEVPNIVFRIGEIGLVLLGLQALVSMGDTRFSFVLPAVLYFLAFTAYATVIAVNASRKVEGITKQRLRAVAAGSSFLGMIIMLAGVGAFVPSIVGNTSHIVNETVGLLCGFSYFIAFATPLTLRRAWLEPVLRDYFGGALALAQVSDQRVMFEQLEESTRDAFGGTMASLGLWDEQGNELVFPSGSIGIERGKPEDMIEGDAFLSQGASFSSNLSRDYPNAAGVYQSLRANTVLSAPVTSRGHQYGVLSVYLSGSPMFIEDDLALMSLMADQAGVILESRALVEEETRLRAREEALKLRNDFLASVAHDLKTPLTALVMQSQLLERRARRAPDAPPDADGLHQIIVQTHRLRSFIEDLLDVQRSEDEGLILAHEPCSLTALIQEIGDRVCVEPHLFVLDSESDVRVMGDRARLTQLFDNLIGNAVKYSPDGGEVRMRIWHESDDIHVTVSDQGVGISEQDLPYIFERHHRGENAHSHGVHGIGLGLFICRAIVQAHGGSLEVSSSLMKGSTFHVVIPQEPAQMSDSRTGPRLVPNAEQPAPASVPAKSRLALGG